MNVVETSGLGKQYGKLWALRDCTVEVPEGQLAALVGPNGAGKSTLMNMAVGLSVPTAGTVTVLGGRPTGSQAALDGIAFMAQDAPLYKNISAADMLHLTRNLNRSFDDSFAKKRLDGLGIPLKKKSGKLSGGQQAQLALTLALARHPRLLILDEPLSALDPLARQDFMATVMTSMTDDGVSVLLSSHAIAELERIADYLVVLGGGELRISGETDEMLAERIEEMNVLAATVFETRGIAFAAWALVAFTIGAFLGMLFRRIIPAMAATLGVYLVLALAAWDLRKYYPVALVTSNPKIDNVIGGPNSPWLLSTWFTGPGGKPASQSVINQFQSNPSPKASLPQGYTEWTEYIPVSHFWPMQFFEAGWLLALSAALIAGTVWLVRHRAA